MDKQDFKSLIVFCVKTHNPNFKTHICVCVRAFQQLFGADVLPERHHRAAPRTVTRLHS